MTSKLTIEQGCFEYIALLDATDHNAPVNCTHHVLRGLNNLYGSDNVNTELRRQFEVQELEIRND